MSELGNIAADKMARARSLRANGVSYGRIVAATGLSLYVLKCEFDPGYRARNADCVRRGKEARQRMSKRARLPLKGPPLPVVGSAGNVQDMTRAPPHVLADRDRRMAMQPRDLTAALFGDPPTADWYKRG